MPSVTDDLSQGHWSPGYLGRTPQKLSLVASPPLSIWRHQARYRDRCSFHGLPHVGKWDTLSAVNRSSGHRTTSLAWLSEELRDSRAAASSTTTRAWQTVHPLIWDQNYYRCLPSHTNADLSSVAPARAFLFAPGSASWATHSSWTINPYLRMPFAREINILMPWWWLLIKVDHSY